MVRTPEWLHDIDMPSTWQLQMIPVEKEHRVEPEQGATLFKAHSALHLPLVLLTIILPPSGFLTIF